MSTSRPLLIVQHHETNGPGALTGWLDRAGVDYEICTPFTGAAHPTDPTAYAGAIMLGGAMSALSDDGFPWRADALTFISECVRTQTPLLAMCLSAQLMTHALGGTVERGSEGIEVGAMLVARKDISGEDELFRVLPLTPDVIEFHRDSITAMPPGAVQLLGGPVYPYQAYRVGPRAWAMQFHIETTPEMFTGWVEDARDYLEFKGFDVDLLLERAVAAHPDVHATWEPFTRRFAQLATEHSMA